MIRFAAIVLLSLTAAHAETCPAAMVPRAAIVPFGWDAGVLRCPPVGLCWQDNPDRSGRDVMMRIICLSPEEEARAEGRAR